MKLSGQMTPNDKNITDKYTYGWKPVQETTTAKDSVDFVFFPIAFALTVTTLDEEMKRSRPPQKNCNMSFNESCILIACKYVLFKVLF